MHKKRTIFGEYVIYFGILVFVLFLAPRYLVEKYLVDGTSMENALHDNEQVLVEKVSRYFDGPERFDIVVFTKNHGTYTKNYIKRVIGLPGETVQIIDNCIFINGEILEESYGKNPMEDAGIASEPLVLGENEYFVLGDNRRFSVDSRTKAVGTVKTEELVGVVILRIAPFGRVE